MPDLREQTAHFSAGDIGTPALAVRNDAGGDLAAANLNRVMLQVDASGALKNNPEGMFPTFSASVLDLAFAATPTDLAVLPGSATKTVKLHRVEVAISSATGPAGVADLQLVKRITANTGGTSSPMPVVPWDSNDTSTAIPVSYTANPTTLGTAVGTIRGQKIANATPGATVGSASLDSVIWEFGTRFPQKLPTLRGVAQSIAVNGNGATFGATTTGTITFDFIECPNTV